MSFIDYATKAFGLKSGKCELQINFLFAYCHTNGTRVSHEVTRGPFLESPGNFSGPKLNIQIET